jgi:predicted PolB exonuclease-like 3'-5' exonuclease
MRRRGEAGFGEKESITVFKLVANEVWAFDAEWAPDAISGRAAYDLPNEMSDADVIEEMWKRGGATAENPHPYLKTALCRIVSVAVVRRRTGPGREVRLDLFSLPSPDQPDVAEASIVGRFLDAVGKAKPQLVGFNSISADLVIFVQRAVANGLTAPAFCKRPDKPWEGVDYFARGSDWHVDLREELGGWGRSGSTLHEIATACGIPGKLDVSGDNVADMWFGSDRRRIVQYNECDSITTYLLWLRTAHFGGFLSTDEYKAEQRQFHEMLESKAADPANDHLVRYLDRWDALRQRRDREIPELAPNS